MRAVKMAMAALAATMVMGAAVSVPIASASEGATMDLAAMQFPGGGVIPTDTSGSVPVTPGSTVDLTTPATLPDSSDSQDQYQFLFWDVDGTISTTDSTSFTAPAAGTTFDAYAWYRLTGPSGPCSGTCPPALTTWAFSAPENEILSGTPIASATSGWTAGSLDVLTADAPSVTALRNFAPAGTSPKEQLLYPPFLQWISFFGTGVTTSGFDGITLNVPANESPWAIAFYGAGSSSVLPCQHGISPTCT